MSLRKQVDEIKRRLAMVTEDYEMAKRNEIGITQVYNGNNPFMTSTNFHRARVQLLEWMNDENTTVEMILQKRAQMEEELGPMKILKYGSMHAVPDEVVLKIALVEQMELAVGLHPVQQRVLIKKPSITR